MGIKQGLTDFRRSDEGVQHTTISLYVTLSRRQNFYYFNLCFPMFLLGFISFVSFFLDLTALNDRMSVSENASSFIFVMRYLPVMHILNFHKYGTYITSITGAVSM